MFTLQVWNVELLSLCSWNGYFRTIYCERWAQFQYWTRGRRNPRSVSNWIIRVWGEERWLFVLLPVINSHLPWIVSVYLYMIMRKMAEKPYFLGFVPFYAFHVRKWSAKGKWANVEGSIIECSLLLSFHGTLWCLCLKEVCRVPEIYRQNTMSRLVGWRWWKGHSLNLSGRIIMSMPRAMIIICYGAWVQEGEAPVQLNTSTIDASKHLSIELPVEWNGIKNARNGSIFRISISVFCY